MALIFKSTVHMTPKELFERIKPFEIHEDRIKQLLKMRLVKEGGNRDHSQAGKELGAGC